MVGTYRYLSVIFVLLSLCSSSSSSSYQPNDIYRPPQVSLNRPVLRHSQPSRSANFNQVVAPLGQYVFKKEYTYIVRNSTLGKKRPIFQFLSTLRSSYSTNLQLNNKYLTNQHTPKRCIYWQFNLIFITMPRLAP